ncbi:MAG: helix-turn-helix domain-containing protein [Bdellovibrionales bacterium]|nr:helix-turn-helix domain-containing protein [Bdellovibrionales bacterium]
MSSRSQMKRITLASRTLKFLRQQAGLSTRGAARVSGLHDGVINHLENGRITIHPRHLEKLLQAYQVPLKTYELFASGEVKLPVNLHAECIELIHQMSLEQLRTVHPVLLSLAGRG